MNLQGAFTMDVESKVNPVSKIFYGELYHQFSERVSVEGLGLHVVVMWECEWAKLCRTDQSVRAFLSTYRIPEHLNPREALLGSHTNAMKLYHKGEGDEKNQEIQSPAVWDVGVVCAALEKGYHLVCMD